MPRKSTTSCTRSKPATARSIAQIRCHSKANSGWTLQTESADAGKTWSEPHPICLRPAFPFAEAARRPPAHDLRPPPQALWQSVAPQHDHGKTWGEPLIVSDDGIGGDLGYPSTVELADGTLLTVWYEKMKQLKYAVLRQSRWKLS